MYFIYYLRCLLVLNISIQRCCIRGHRRIYHWATWAMPPPPFELRKNLAYGKKMQPKCAIFRQKSQKFSAEGAQPPPQTLPPLGKEIPLTRHSPSAHLTLSAAALEPLQFFSNFYHYARLR